MRGPRFHTVRRPVSVERLMAELHVPLSEAERIHAAGNAWSVAREPVVPSLAAVRRREARRAREARAAAARETAVRICGE